MIITVTPNPAVDLTWHVERIVPGGTHRADAAGVRAGGKGLNVARVAHAQGAEVLAVATVGGATGGEFSLELNESGVPNLLVPVTASTRRSVALVDESLGDTTIVNERGVAPSGEEWQALQDAVRGALRPAQGLSQEGVLEHVEGPAVLVISGSLPPGTPDDVLPALVGLGRASGCAVIVDTSGPALVAAADAGASVLKPNGAELSEATGIPDPIEAARDLLRRGAEVVLVSLGADGMLAVSGGDDTVLHARIPQPLAGNPTGAGDAAVAACAVLIDSGIRDPAQILRRATAWSAAAVLMPLAGEIHPSWPELESSLVVEALPEASVPVSLRKDSR